MTEGELGSPEHEAAAEPEEPLEPTEPTKTAAEAPAASSPYERFAPLVVGVLLALPTLLAFYPPMSDLPLHEGVVGVLRHLHDPTWYPGDIYRLNLGHPNQLFHMLAWLLSYGVGTRWAVKIVIALAQIAIFHGGSKLADHLGRSRWGVMMLAPLALGFTYYWGLVANLVGFAAFLYALPVIDRMVEAPTRKRVLGVCGVMVGLYFAHESTFLLGTGVIALFTVARPWNLKLMVPRLAPAAFATMLGLGHLAYQNAHIPQTEMSALKIPSEWFSIATKTKFMPNVLFGSHDTMALLLLVGLGLLGMGTLLASRVQHDPEAASTIEDPWRWRQLVYRFRYEAVALVYLVLYFAMPFRWNGATLVHERFLAPAWGILVVVVAPKLSVPRLAKLAGSVLPLGVLLVNWPQFANATDAFQDLEAVMEPIPYGKAVGICILDHSQGFTRIFSAGPAPARLLAVRGGRAGLALTGSPIAPVQIKNEFLWSEFDTRGYVWGTRAFIPRFDLQRWEYVVASSRSAGVRLMLVEAFRPEAELVAEKGEWLLFRSKLPVAPLASGNARPTQADLDDTVLHRVNRIQVRIMRESGTVPLAPPRFAPLESPDAKE